MTKTRNSDYAFACHRALPRKSSLLLNVRCLAPHSRPLRLRNLSENMLFHRRRDRIELLKRTAYTGRARRPKVSMRQPPESTWEKHHIHQTYARLSRISPTPYTRPCIPKTLVAPPMPADKNVPPRHRPCDPAAITHGWNDARDARWRGEAPKEAQARLRRHAEGGHGVAAVRVGRHGVRMVLEVFLQRPELHDRAFAHVQQREVVQTDGIVRVREMPRRRGREVPVAPLGGT